MWWEVGPLLRKVQARTQNVYCRFTLIVGRKRPLLQCWLSYKDPREGARFWFPGR